MFPASHILLTDPRGCGTDGTLKDECNHGLGIMFVEYLESTSLTLVPPLLLYTLGPLDVNNFIKLQFCLVGVFGSVNNSRPIPTPRKQVSYETF